MPYGAIRSASRNGLASCRRRSRSSPSASTGSTSAVKTAGALRKAGFDARYMAGGHFGWKAAKGPVTLFEPTASANT